MKLSKNALLAGAIYLVSCAVQAADLSGYWKNDDRPGWIEIVIEEGVATGTVRRNDAKPEAVGRILLKDLVRDEDKPGTWRGQVYAERFEEYRDTEVIQPEPDQMQIKVKVGFMSRTVDWTRVDEAPAE